MVTSLQRCHRGEPPSGIPGPFNFGIRQIQEDYYRGLVGPTGTAIRVSGLVRNLQMQENNLIKPETAKFEYVDPTPGW